MTVFVLCVSTRAWLTVCLCARVYMHTHVLIFCVFAHVYTCDCGRADISEDTSIFMGIRAFVLVSVRVHFESSCFSHGSILATISQDALVDTLTWGHLNELELSDLDFWSPLWPLLIFALRPITCVMQQFVRLGVVSGGLWIWVCLRSFLALSAGGPLQPANHRPPKSACKVSSERRDRRVWFREGTHGLHNCASCHTQESWLGDVYSAV